MGNDHPPPESFAIFVCRSCGLSAIANVPSAERLRDLYEDTAYPVPDTGRETIAKCRSTWLELQPLLRAGDILLDVGAGSGIFLRVLQEEAPWLQAVGLEPYRQDVMDGVAIYRAVADVPGLVRVAALLDVAEHVADPRGFLTSLRAIIAPEGFLYIHTPRRCFWDSVALWCATMGVRPRLILGWLRTRLSIAHLQLWSDRALRLALQDAGFTIRSYRRACELSYPVEWYAGNYVGQKLGMPATVVRAVTIVARLIIRAGLLRNKAVILAQRT